MHHRVCRCLLVGWLALNGANVRPVGRVVHISEATVVTVNVGVTAASIVAIVPNVTVSVHVHLVRLSLVALLEAVKGAGARLRIVLEL